jgi:hypothetical protein
MNSLKKLADLMRRCLHIDRQLDQIKMNQGLILTELQDNKRSAQISGYEFKIFSQWGEDGIIQFLTRNIAVKNRTFIEFGVEDFSEANCRFLLMKDHWSGFVIDGSQTNMDRLHRSYYYWSHPLKSKASFITRENVAQLLDESGMDKELGILSVDIDGVDYHVLEALEAWQASIVIVEYNAIFGHQRAVSVPYDAAFVRSKAHTSNVYYGASLPAFEQLLSSRGYALVGINSVGSNAFFVKRHLLNDRVKEVPVEACDWGPTFREARKANGDLAITDKHMNLLEMASMPLIDTITGQRISVADIIASPPKSTD